MPSTPVLSSARRGRRNRKTAAKNGETRMNSRISNNAGRTPKSRLYDLEERLVSFAVRVIRLSEALPKTPVVNHVRCQIFRCGTSPAANYGEAQSAESRSDFAHTVKVILNELRETGIRLLISLRAGLLRPSALLEPLLGETNELISVLVASHRTSTGKR